MVWIDDISDMTKLDEVLNWACSEAFPVNIKFSSAVIRPKVIICTSNMSIQTLCGKAKYDEENISAVENRFI